jgi:hypothetical protein
MVKRKEPAPAATTVQTIEYVLAKWRAAPPRSRVIGALVAVPVVYIWLGREIGVLPLSTKAPTTATSLASIGGAVWLSAGDNGGGALVIEHSDIHGGDGTTKGGDVTVTAGAGGLDGPGGNVTVGPGTIPAARLSARADRHGERASARNRRRPRQAKPLDAAR